jgi:chorismate mutase
MEELEKLRKEIDKLDKMIAELISKRQGLSYKILEAKGGDFTYDPVRERKVMEKIFSYNIDSKLAERIWRQIISFNLSKQKKLKIGYLGDDKFSVAAYESYFGPYFENRNYKNVTKLMEGISNKIIDAAIIEKSQLVLTKINSKIKIVSEFPLNENFYKKKYLILK